MILLETVAIYNAHFKQLNVGQEPQSVQYKSESNTRPAMKIYVFSLIGLQLAVSQRNSDGNGIYLMMQEIHEVRTTFVDS